MYYKLGIKENVTLRGMFSYYNTFMHSGVNVHYMEMHLLYYCSTIQLFVSLHKSTHNVSHQAANAATVCLCVTVDGN